MNDFTKEELESTIAAFEHIESGPSWRETQGWDDKLKAKIQFMIENYGFREAKITVFDNLPGGTGGVVSNE